MTPAEFEWAQEQIELAYERGDIGKLAFIKRMSELGFNNLDAIRETMRDIDAKRK